MISRRALTVAVLAMVAALVPGCGSKKAEVMAKQTTTTETATGPGSATQPIPMNTAAAVSDAWKVKVVETVPDAVAMLRAGGRPDAKPPAGRQFFAVKVELTYVGGGTASPEYSLTFKALDGQNTYSEQTDDCGVLADPVPAADLVSGAATRGTVCWAVRPEKLASLAMVVNSGFLDTNQIYFALE